MRVLFVSQYSFHQLFGGGGGIEIKYISWSREEILAVPSQSEAISIVALEAVISKPLVLLTEQCGFSSLADIGAEVEVPATVNGIT